VPGEYFCTLSNVVDCNISGESESVILSVQELLTQMYNDETLYKNSAKKSAGLSSVLSLRAHFLNMKSRSRNSIQ
jgi:hypothetical protein